MGLRLEWSIFDQTPKANLTPFFLTFSIQFFYSGQGVVGDQNPVRIGQTPLSRPNQHTRDVQHQVRMALARPKASPGVGGNGPDPHLALDHLGDIPNTAVNEQPSPTIFLCQLSQVAPYQGAAIAPPTINDQNPSLSRGLQRLPNHHVVLKDLQGCNRPRHDLGTPIVLKDRRQDPKAAGCQPLL
jgi:hypothetical protein